MVYMVTVLLLDFYQTTYECSKVRLKKDFFFIFFFPFFKHRYQCKRSNQSDSTSILMQIWYMVCGLGSITELSEYDLKSTVSLHDSSLSGEIDQCPEIFSGKAMCSS